MNEATTITPKMLAEELGVDAKTVRKFLRSISPERAGKGGRWAIDADDLEVLRTKFAEFTARRSTMLVIPDDAD